MSAPEPKAEPPCRLHRADRALAVALRTRGHSERRERLAQRLGLFGEWGIGWAAIGLGAAAIDPRRRRAWSAAAAAGASAVLVNYAFKLTVRRERPEVEGYPPLGPAASRLSFPSAHATSSAAAATALGRVEPAARPLLYALAAAITLGRPYLGMHYPSDVIAGTLLGGLIGRHWPLGPTGGGAHAGRQVWAK